MQLELPFLALAVACLLVLEPSVNAELTSTLPPPTTTSDVMLFNASNNATMPPMCQCLFNANLQENELVCKSREESIEEDADLQDLVRWSCQFVKIEISNLDINAVFADAFSSRPDLTIVYLYSDFIEQIDVEAFRGLNALVDVDLSDNSLLSVDPRMFVANHQLKTVSLADNPLVELNPNAPILESDSITSLDLSFCKLKTLTKESFAKLPSLQHLDLSSNDIQYLPMAALLPTPQLSKFNIGNNRWNCDCAFKEVMKFAKRMEVPEKRVRCYGPDRVMEYWSEKSVRKYCPEPEIICELPVFEGDNISVGDFSASKEDIIVTVVGVTVGFVVFVAIVAVLVRKTAHQRRNRVYRTSISSEYLIPGPKASIVRQQECGRHSNGDNVSAHLYEQIG